MKALLQLGAVLLVAPILFGCVGAWDKTPTPKLCQQLSQEEPNTWGRMSRNYYAVVEELERRDEDCSEYIKRDMSRTSINNSTKVDIKN